MSELITAIGLVLVIEGILYGGLPRFAKRLAAEVVTMPEQILRWAGLASIGGGVFLVWLVRG